MNLSQEGLTSMTNPSIKIQPSVNSQSRAESVNSAKLTFTTRPISGIQSAKVIFNPSAKVIVPVSGVLDNSKPTESKVCTSNSCNIKLESTAPSVSSEEILPVSSCSSVQLLARTVTSLSLAPRIHIVPILNNSHFQCIKVVQPPSQLVNNPREISNPNNGCRIGTFIVRKDNSGSPLSAVRPLMMCNALSTSQSQNLNVIKVEQGSVMPGSINQNENSFDSVGKRPNVMLTVDGNIISRHYQPDTHRESTDTISQKQNRSFDLIGKHRRPCNCTRSMCLKLYCECFSSGHFCQSCNCTNCHNSLEHEEERNKAIRSTLVRNPNAFKSKIGMISLDINSDRSKSRNQKTSGCDGLAAHSRHIKGCNCKKSNCLKKYCECYEARIPCSSLCRCIGCKNMDEAYTDCKPGTEPRDRIRRFEKIRPPTLLDRLPAQPVYDTKAAYTFVTTEVVEATASCMLAQAEECLRRQHSIVYTEQLVLEEFGRCMLQIVESSQKTQRMYLKLNDSYNLK